MNEIVNIIDRRAGVGRPVRTGKQKQAERGARRERRGVLYAAGVGSRSSPFYHPNSLDSTFFFTSLPFLFSFSYLTCFDMFSDVFSTFVCPLINLVTCFDQPFIAEELFTW